ncbi:MAG: hypothetical protein EA388_15955, partial [Nitriliruptor sp.]
FAPDVTGHVGSRTSPRMKVRASVETATGLLIDDTMPEDSAAELAAVLAARPEAPDAPIPDVEVTPVAP